MSDDWVPLGLDQAELAAQHEGIPAWMGTRFWPWLEATTNALANRARLPRSVFVAEYDERARLRDPLAPHTNYDIQSVLQKRGDDGLTLLFTDFLLMKLIRFGGSVDSLEHILSRAGSAWRAGQRGQFGGLERRVPVGVQEAADAVMTNAGNAGQILSEAWHALYGVNPNYDVAYKKAILAVEAAGGQKVTPRDTVGTLGKMTTAMRDQGWVLPLADDPKHPSSDVLWKMAKAMVAGEQSRHATKGTYTSAAPKEAESAVFLAVSLVQFFHADLAQKR